MEKVLDTNLYTDPVDHIFTDINQEDIYLLSLS